MKIYRIAQAAEYVGLTPRGLRQACVEGRIEYDWTASHQRIFNKEQLDAFLGRKGKEAPKPARVEAFYCRVSGTTGQESSLANQEDELRKTATAAAFKVYKDRASGLRENRKALDRMLDDAAEGRFNVLRVTHSDRLARFGSVWIERYLKQCGVELEVLHAKADKSIHEELMEDFLAIIASFSGRFYKMRSKENQVLLLETAREKLDGA